MEKQLLKIIYFDEEAAIDYITISDGGKTMSEIISQFQETDKENVNADTHLGVGIPFLTWFNLKAKIGVSGSVNSTNDEVMKSTLTNTILTDYIKKTQDDKNVKKFRNYKISPIKDSLSYYKMYTPYTLLIKKELNDKISSEVDITKIDEVLKETKGYYEFLAYKNREQIIIRFNINSFKNNYKLGNILGMELVLYGINVGSAELKDFSIDNLFEQKEEKEISAGEILGKSNPDIKEELKIYDIILAGVENEK